MNEEIKYPAWVRWSICVFGGLFMWFLVCCGVGEVYYGLHHPHPVVEQR